MTRSHRIFSRIGLVATVLLVGIAVPAIVNAAAVFTAHLTGKEEVPVRETRATGQATFKLASDQTSLDFKVILSNIENVVAVRIHQAPVGATGPEVAVLFGPVAPAGGRTSGQLAVGTLTAANLVGPMAGQTIPDLISQIQAGQIYVNVVTDDGLAPPDSRSGDFNSGEIRGQIK